jgi:uncharacterized membrane protein (UPF0182 family)
VVGDDGRLSWIIDALHFLSSYPYSARSNLGKSPVNYIRNSVKAVVDAYDGTVTFYVFDFRSHPRGMARHLSRDCSRTPPPCPPGCARTCAILKLLLSLQAEVYGLYHMTNPEVFYNREDQWTWLPKMDRARAATRPRSPCNPTSC